MSPTKKIAKTDKAKKVLATNQLEDKTWDTNRHKITNMLDVESWSQEDYYWYYDGEALLSQRQQEDNTSVAHDASEYLTDSDGFMPFKFKGHKSKTHVPTSQVAMSKQKDLKFNSAVSTSNVFSPLEKHQDTQENEVPIEDVPEPCINPLAMSLSSLIPKKKYLEKQNEVPSRRTGWPKAVAKLCGGAPCPNQHHSVPVPKDSDNAAAANEIEHPGQDAEQGVGAPRKCLHCGIIVVYRVAHLRQSLNTACKNAYLNKYRGTAEWLRADDGQPDQLLVLQKVFRQEEKAKRRGVNENRMEENRQRNQNNKKLRRDVKKCVKEFVDSIEAIKSEQCQYCFAWVSPKDGCTAEDDEASDDECDNFMIIEIFMCKWCNAIRVQEENWCKFGGDEENFKAEYSAWAEKHFTLRKKLKSMIKSSQESPNIGLKMFNDEAGRHVVMYPDFKYNENKIDIEDEEEGKETWEPIVLVPQELFENYPKDKNGKDESQLIIRSPNQNRLNVFGVMITDRLEIMRIKKTMMEKRNSEIRKGKAVGNTVNVRESNSFNGCLSYVKGSLDYLKRERNDLIVRQCQNGVKNIKIDWRVFSGFNHHLEDSHLASCLLRVNNHIIKFMEKSGTDKFPSREYRVCCDYDSCDPFTCLTKPYHETPIEKLQNSDFDLDPLVITKFMVEKVEAFINKIVKPLAKEYALFLTFERPSKNGGSGFNLAGHIWLDELESYNSSGKPVPIDIDFVPEVVSPAYMKKMFGGNGVVEVVEKIVTWPYNLQSDGNDRTKNVWENVTEIEDRGSCREVSVFEAVCLCDRDILVSYTNQSVVFINTNDPRHVWRTFRAKQKADDHEQVRTDPSDKTFWVEEESQVKQYTHRPDSAEFLCLLQGGVHYRELETSNPNYKQKLKDLEKSGGILESTVNLVRVVTNKNRFPDAPTFLPQYILLRNRKILTLKKKENVVSYSNNENNENITNLILVEPWRSPDDLDWMETDAKLVEDVMRRKKLILPLSSA